MRRCKYEKCPYCTSEPCIFSDQEYKQQIKWKGRACPKSNEDPFDEASEDDFYCVILGNARHFNKSKASEFIDKILRSYIDTGKKVIIFTDDKSEVSQIAALYAEKNKLPCYRFYTKEAETSEYNVVWKMFVYAGMQKKHGAVAFCDIKEYYGQRILELANQNAVQLRIKNLFSE